MDTDKTREGAKEETATKSKRDREPIKQGETDFKKTGDREKI
jgi:hypothetical protein